MLLAYLQSHRFVVVADIFINLRAWGRQAQPVLEWCKSSNTGYSCLTEATETVLYRHFCDDLANTSLCHAWLFSCIKSTISDLYFEVIWQRSLCLKCYMLYRSSWKPPLKCVKFLWLCLFFFFSLKKPILIFKRKVSRRWMLILSSFFKKFVLCCLYSFFSPPPSLK